MEWQPIETAPLDVPILITDGKIVTVTNLARSTGSNRIWMYSYGFGGYEFDYDFEFEQATHWMLLPSLPVAPVAGP